MTKLYKFTITTPDGTKYEFGNNNESLTDIANDAIEITKPFNNLCDRYASSWYLKRIISYDGLDVISLFYKKENYRYGYRASAGAPSQNTLGSALGGYRAGIMDIIGCRLETITTSSAKESVTLIANVNRNDLDVTPGTSDDQKAKRLSSISIQTGAFCKQFILSHSYFEDNSAAKSGQYTDFRLKLNSVQEMSCTGADVIKPYVFTYNQQPTNPNYLPNRLTGAVDHWGYFNGATGNPRRGLNIPYTRLIYTVQYTNNTSKTFDVKEGFSNRETNPDSMKLGTISQIQYPTGGTTAFDYEANTYWDSAGVKKTIDDGAFGLFWTDGGQCTMNNTSAPFYKTFDVIDNYFYAWATKKATNYCTNCTCTGNPSNVILKVFQGSGTVALGSKEISCGTNDTIINIETDKLSYLFPFLQAGINYRFELTGSNSASRFLFHKEVLADPALNNRKVGGLRIKTMTISDGVNTANNTVKTYDYSSSIPSISSGVLYNRPAYGHVFRNTVGYCNQVSTAAFVRHTFMENTIVPLSSFEGYHIGYRKVKEYINNGFGTEYNYEVEGPEPFTGFPRAPEPPRIRSGELVSKIQFDAHNHKDQLIEKNIGLTGSSALQSIDYTYNIRGWLTNINNVALFTNGTTSIMTPPMSGSSPIQNLAITPFINKAVQDAVQPYRASNANELPPLLDDGVNVDLFSQNITYGNPAAQTGAASQNNGNISSTTWQVLGRAKQAYGFTYDGLDRLTEAKYFDITEGYVNGQLNSQYSTDNKFKETIQYDIRGNILGLQRNGFKNGAWTVNNYTAAEYGQIDNLSYSYNAKNQVLNIVDGAVNFNGPNSGKDYKGFVYNPSASLLDNNVTGGNHYAYDKNGNLLADLHKDITLIEYNFLNLPQVITFTGGRSIKFVYDASGAKLKKITNDNGTIVTYDYINGVEYKNNVLQRFAHSEGAVARNSYGAFEHEYVLRDHLGNARVTFTDGINYGDPYINWDTYQYVEPNAGNTTGLNDGVITAADIKQVNHYYAFGLNMEGNWQGAAQGTNKYQYNEKELNTDFGLNWNDYGARMYDATMGKFTTQDRFSEMYGHMTPYQYAANNPIRYIDVNGDSIPTYFFDQQANMSSDIPEQLQQSVACEHGVGLGYNTTTHKLYYAGDVQTDNPISPSGRAALLQALGAGTTRTSLLFGYNLHYYTGQLTKKGGKNEIAPVQGGTTAGHKTSPTAIIDLADWDGSLQLKGQIPNESYLPRSYNLMRAIEHEFFGHGEKFFPGYNENEKNVPYINATFTNIPQIPGRDGYTDANGNDNFLNGGISYWDRKTKNAKKDGTVDYKWLWRRGTPTDPVLPKIEKKN